MKNDSGNLLQNFNRPVPPPDLRERTLHAAGLALSCPAPSDYWRAVWETLWLRMAWSAGVAALLVGHIVISKERVVDLQDRSLPVILVAADPENELLEIVGLSRINESLPTFVGLRRESSDIGEGDTKGDVS